MKAFEGTLVLQNVNYVIFNKQILCGTLVAGCLYLAKAIKYNSANDLHISTLPFCLCQKQLSSEPRAAGKSELINATLCSSPHCGTILLLLAGPFSFWEPLFTLLSPHVRMHKQG